MPIQFEQVTGEIAPERGAGGAETQAPAAPEGAEELREKLQHELALLHERRLRLFAD